ncbi:MAG: MOSC domain-containing protein [Kiritimatiellae bacterium]|nr:MOSC domain-containing protein [Kiritimatiellia bacterium]
MTDARTLKVVSVNLSEQTGTRKHPVAAITLGERGIQGDAHAGHWHRQVSLLALESIERFVADTGRRTAPGEFAENITTQGLDLRDVAVLDTFTCRDILLEVTQIGKACHGDACAIFREVGKCAMPKEGLFCRVLKGGTLRAGDELVYRARPLQIRIVTLSDRAARGEYEDRSGPEIEARLRDFFKGKRWHPTLRRVLLPDDAEALRAELQGAVGDGAAAVFTTGGTGVGPRDTTPEVVTAFCEKTIPGIMEAIRLKFGAEKPNALLSRSVAGVKGQTLVYALPGSVKAVREYVGEIVKTFEHLILTVHGIDAHPQ